jgi:hypothetical protein
VGCGAAPHGTTITGTLTNGTYTNSYSLTLDRNPDSFTLSAITGQALSTTATSNSVTLAGTNAPAYITYTAGSPNTLTNLQVAVGGGAYVTVPASGTTLTVNPGQTLQFQGDVGGTNSTAYTITVNVGATTAAWSVTTTALAPTITTPAITSPANGATDINPGLVIPAVATLNSSAYTANNGAGAVQTSSNWEVYKGGYPLGPSANTITVVTPGTAGTPSGIQYKGTQSGDTNPNSEDVVYGGPATSQFNDVDHPMFQWASALSIGGFTDWYIPAKNELAILYFFLKPDTSASNTGSGNNPNSVAPYTPNTNYGPGFPNQTTSALFQVGRSECFPIAGTYWTSSQFSGLSGYAWCADFQFGGQSGNPKDNGGNYARAIRRITIADYIAWLTTGRWFLRRQNFYSG